MKKIHNVIAKKYYRTFSKDFPVLKTINSGDIVITRTLDSGGQDIDGKHLSEPGNPLTGPFYVENSSPGDTLQVHISQIKMNRNWGYTSYRLGLFAITPDSIENTYSKNYKQDAIRKGRNDLISWDIDLKTKKVRFQDKNTGNHKMEFLAEPMLGCIGVAPEGNFNPTSGPSGEWGGNIDYNQIVEGSTVYLPVFQEGAYLYVGDGHALQADGEPLGTGIETSMDLEFSVKVIKNKKINMPRLETSNFISSIGSQPEFSSDLNRGLQIATSEMITWLIEDYKMKPWAAHLLIGMVAKYEVITVAGSVGLKIMKKHLPK